ncbi:facilitated trehalose transporter Tret1-like [Anticarsia gemmatalis]|uniref:facilitated trehalose transporter Tret1-like n=1 Tax=Anticarsia gemmatalis TaxID=129554 RepID=UPI003F761FCF
MFKVFNGAISRQYLVIMSANLSMLCFGLAIAWPSPMLVKLKEEEDTGLPRPVTDEEASWIASIGVLCGLPLSCVIGLIMDRIGRKTCLALATIPRLAVALILTFATQIWMVMLARAIDGVITNALVISVLPTYNSEIASKEIRGALGTTSQVVSATGMLILFGIAPFLPYLYVNVLYLCIVAAVTLVTWFLPESPYFLYSKGRKSESIKVLTYLRCSETLAAEEINQYEAALHQQVKKLSTREVFQDPVTLKTLAKVILLSILLELTGFSAMLIYMMEILKSTQTTVSDNVASLVMGFIQLIACFFTILMTDRFGRKPILVTTLFGMAIGMAGLGTFFHLKLHDYHITGFLNFMPLISLILIIFCFNAGLGSLFWVVVPELFDGPARAVGVSIAGATATLFVFLTIKYFPAINKAVGPAPTYWWFTVTCVITGLVIWFFVPETKGRTFGEIQEKLGRKTGKVCEIVDKI